MCLAREVGMSDRIYCLFTQDLSTEKNEYIELDGDPVGAYIQNK